MRIHALSKSRGGSQTAATSALPAPFFQRVKVIAAILHAKVTRRRSRTIGAAIKKPCLAADMPLGDCREAHGFCVRSWPRTGIFGPLASRTTGRRAVQAGRRFELVDHRHGRSGMSPGARGRHNGELFNNPLPVPAVAPIRLPSFDQAAAHGHAAARMAARCGPRPVSDSGGNRSSNPRACRTDQTVDTRGGSARLSSSHAWGSDVLQLGPRGPVHPGFDRRNLGRFWPLQARLARRRIGGGRG